MHPLHAAEGLWHERPRRDAEESGAAGEPSVAGTLADIEAVYDCLRTRYGREPRDIVLYGQSVGRCVRQWGATWGALWGRGVCNLSCAGEKNIPGDSPLVRIRDGAGPDCVPEGVPRVVQHTGAASCISVVWIGVEPTAR